MTRVVLEWHERGMRMTWSGVYGWPQQRGIRSAFYLHFWQRWNYLSSGSKAETHCPHEIHLLSPIRDSYTHSIVRNLAFSPWLLMADGIFKRWSHSIYPILHALLMLTPLHWGVKPPFPPLNLDGTLQLLRPIECGAVMLWFLRPGSKTRMTLAWVSVCQDPSCHVLRKLKSHHKAMRGVFWPTAQLSPQPIDSTDCQTGEWTSLLMIPAPGSELPTEALGIMRRGKIMCCLNPWPKKQRY